MPACFFIVVEGEDPGFDIFVHGRALARNEDALELLSERLGVSSLLEFFSADQNAMALLLEQGSEESAMEHGLSAPLWFGGADGLLTVRTLLDYFAANPAALGSETRPVVQELREFERVLQKTEQRGLHWHLSVSWL